MTKMLNLLKKKITSSFQNVLQSLITENGIDAKTLAKDLNLFDSSTVYKWLKGQKGLLLPTAIKIADYFYCTLDYLMGRAIDYFKFEFKECPPFDMRFRKLLEENHTKQNQLVKDKILSKGHINNWLNKKRAPHIESIIRLADYFKVTIDNVVGRE